MNSHTTWTEMQKIMHYSVVWNDLHEFHRLQVFAELMRSYHDIEAQENRKDLQRKARHLREDFRGVLERLIRSDQFTFRSKYKEIFPRIKDEESFYATLLEEVSAPREVYVLYKFQLAEDHRKTKEAFKALLKGRVEEFPVGMAFEAFETLLRAQPYFSELDARRDTNSLGFYSKYLFKKMQKRQEKSVLKFMKFLYYQSGLRDATADEAFLASLAGPLKAHADKSYFESISTTEKLKWVRQFREALAQGKNLKALIRERKDQASRLKSASAEQRQSRESPAGALGKRAEAPAKKDEKAGEEAALKRWA